MGDREMQPWRRFRRPKSTFITGNLRLSRHARFLIHRVYSFPTPYFLRCFVAASFNGIPLPTSGTKITHENGKFVFPDRPIIPFIEGDGTGRDIWKASVRVFDAAVEKAYGGKAPGGVVRSVRRRKGDGPLQDVAAGRDRGSLPPVADRHQRPADDASRWRHSLA